MANLISGHLSEKQISEAVMDEAGLDGEVRGHLLDCSACRDKKEVLEGRLTRFGQLSREYTPLPLRRPRLAGDRVPSIKPVWKLRPSLGMGLAAALLMVVFLGPHFSRSSKETNLAQIYKEMAQDDKFMTEIEKLEENPLPRFYVEMSDPSEDEPDDSENDLPGRAG
jgi:hypothetical protein